MPRGRPRLSEEEKARRLAEKEAAKAEKAKAREAKTAAKKAKAPSGRGAGRPPKSLAEFVEEVRTGKREVKNLYGTPHVVRAITFTKTLTHALPAHIVSVLPERSATRQAVLADPELSQVVALRQQAQKEFRFAHAAVLASSFRGRAGLDPYARTALAEISTLSKK